jgi:hypothetical protein
VPALALWIAAALLVGVGGLLARRDDRSSATSGSAAATTVPDHVTHTASSAASDATDSSSDIDLSDALVDVTSLGYTEVGTPISGPLTADRLAELAGQSGALGGADFGALLRAAGFRGAFIRLSRSGDGSLAVEQMVLEFDSSAPSGRDFADGLASGLAGVSGGTTESFDVPIADAIGSTLEFTDPSGTTRAAALVEHHLDDRIFVEMILSTDGSTPVSPDDVIAIARAQVDHG